MHGRIGLVFGLALLGLSTVQAQFVWPKKEYNQPVPGTYKEDPFIVEYRKKFFAVFRGDLATFDRAYAEIEEMLEKNPNDARALVWLGNGQTVRAGLWRIQNRSQEAKALLEASRKTLDRAVALRPKDPNIYMMRAATLYIQGQYWPSEQIPKKVWETLRDDCLRFIDYIGPDRMSKVSVHVRGETYGELGVAYRSLGNKAEAIKAFEMVEKLTPNTEYALKAKNERQKLIDDSAR